MVYARRQEGKQPWWLQRHSCEQEVSDIKLVKISYAKCIYEID